MITAVPPKLRRKLDADYGNDGWTYVGHDGHYIDIKFYLSGKIISFNQDRWL